MSELELKGIPTVFVSTVEFVDAAEIQAKAFGFPFSAVFVEHPIQDRTDAEMVEIADKSVDGIIAALVVQ